MSAYIELKNISKTYPNPNGGGPVPVLKDITLSIPEGACFTFFGPNGCGKSTLMSIISGQEPFDEGELRVGTGEPAKVAFVFQDYRQSLLPWLNVENNILFPLMLHGMDRKSGLQKLAELVSALNFNLDYKAPTYGLSGGQAQITAILRALIIGPDILILDEPFSALDMQTTIYLHQQVLTIHERHPELTILFVSHDLDEALYLGDELVVLSRQPGSIVGNAGMPITIPLPRSPDALATTEYGHLRREVYLRFLNGLR